MIERRRNRMILCVTLLVCNLLFIWINSLLPASVSGALSKWVKALLGMASSGKGSGKGDGLLRKIAHFTEFCSLGMLLCWLFAMLKRRDWAFVLPAAACGCLAACVDELLQFFAPGRAPKLTDVGIDAMGVAAGVILVCFGYCIVKMINNIFGGKQQ